MRLAALEVAASSLATHLALGDVQASTDVGGTEVMRVGMRRRRVELERKRRRGEESGDSDGLHVGVGA